MNRVEMVQRFADNVEVERIRLNLTQAQMAEALDISLSSYKRLISCNVDKIDLYVAYRLYLLTGKLAYEYLNLRDTALDLKKKIVGLSLSQISYIDSLVDFEKRFASSHSNFEDYVTVFIPTGNMEDGMIYDSANVEKVNVASYRKKYGSQISCGIKITSNHLHPVYNRDDILLIRRTAVRDGDTGVFINSGSGRAYVRKFYQTSPCRLEPVNGFGETFLVNDSDKSDMDQWIKFGVVLAKIR